MKQFRFWGVLIVRNKLIEGVVGSMAKLYSVELNRPASM